jgi:hypothetical protein
MDDREKRMAQNEALFRDVNERIEAMAHHLGPEVPYEFLCECANPDCTFRLNLTIATYEGVRANPRRFAVLPLHYTPEVEDLVEEHETYWVVEKTGEAGEYVEHLDPRGRDR